MRPEIIGAILAGGGLGSLLRAFAQNKLDKSSSRKTEAEAESIEVKTARELIAEVRSEMDRRVSALTQEVGRLQGHLERVAMERDELRETERALRRENHQLRERVGSLEQRVRVLTTAAELGEATVRVAADVLPTGLPAPVDRRGV